MGDTNTVNNGIYYWHMQMLSPKFSTMNTTAAQW